VRILCVLCFMYFPFLLTEPETAHSRRRVGCGGT
jgi:hypothetical protein